MITRSIAIAFIAGASILSALDIGDPAPDLTGVTAIKGEIPDLSGQWTAVEFWATWCGPCRRSIPHLTGLQAKHKDEVVILGLSNEEEKTVSEFVTKQGDEMAYRVGLVPEETRKAYMAGRSGIPKVFLVSPERRIAWIGHPRNLDPILEKALAGGLDPEQLRTLKPLEDKMNNALRSRNMDQVVEAADAVLAIEPWHQRALSVKLFVAKQQNDPAAARAAYEAIPVDKIGASTARDLAGSMLREPDLQYRFPKLAATFVERAKESEPQAAGTLVLQARLSYVLGDLDQAIQLQQKAVELDAAAKPDLDYYHAVEDLEAE